MALRYSRAHDGAPLRYDDSATDGPAVLLIHGWMASHRVWDALLPLLPGVRIVRPDPRGADGARIDASTCTLDNFVDDVLRVADDAGLERFHVVGHSMGTRSRSASRSVCLAACRGSLC
jgi:pimeloyl-ACP methyl ester carboxylesterase